MGATTLAAASPEAVARAAAVLDDEPRSAALRAFDALERLIEHQRRRVLTLAQELNPRLTSDDVLQPHDYPELRESAVWNYEDGVLAGMMAAQIAARAELRRQGA